jgi:hypothetical protein
VEELMIQIIKNVSLLYIIRPESIQSKLYIHFSYDDQNFKNITCFKKNHIWTEAAKQASNRKRLISAEIEFYEKGSNLHHF